MIPVACQRWLVRAAVVDGQTVSLRAQAAVDARTAQRIFQGNASPCLDIRIAVDGVAAGLIACRLARARCDRDVLRIHDAKISPHCAGVYALDRDRPINENVSIRR